MLEFLFCSLLTILPDYLFRRYRQDRRFGREITLYTVWYELRYGITGCAVLTVSLITVIFYYHPSTTNAGSFFRTLTILSERGGRVEEVYVKINQHVDQGDAIFKLDDSSQRAAVETAERKITEVDAMMILAQSELAAAIGVEYQAESAYKQTYDEYERKKKLADAGSSAVTKREIERLENLLDARQGGIDAALAGQRAVEVKISTLLPAQRATAVSALNQAIVELEKSVIYAGVSGVVEQFSLRPGDYINPILRPAGILVPDDAGRNRIQAGFSQITAQVIKPGMLAEVACVSKPFTVIPMVVTEVQDVIPAGQIRPSDALLDPQDRARPGTLTVFMEPLYEGNAVSVPPGSKCIANAYTNNHDLLDEEGIGAGRWLFLHMVDAVGIAHALLLRIQALLLPVQTLVFSGH